MKWLSFFSRFTFICNICFLLFVIFSKVQAPKEATGSAGTVVSLPFLKDLIIILGFSAIVINLVMCLIYVIIFASKKMVVLPVWVSVVNICFLIFEFYYFFL